MIVTGLILSVEPLVTSAAVTPQSLSVAQLTAILEMHDADGKARMIALDQTGQNVSVIRGRRERNTVDLATGERVSQGGMAASVFGTSRRLHEHFLFDAGWVVTASTFAMLALIALGLLMGWPSIRNTVSGWHKTMAWGLLPLLILSPLTGLGIAYHVSLAGPTPKAARAAAPQTFREAISVIANEHDLSRLLWIRKRSKGMLVRLVEDGEYKVYSVTRAGMIAMPRNWSRHLHEGNGFGVIGALANLVAALAMVGLMGTGLFIWARRKFRRPNHSRRSDAPSPVPGE